MKKIFLLGCCLAVLASAAKTQPLFYAGTQTTISKYDPATGNFSAVHRFDDAGPENVTTLMMAANGKLYGTTSTGGSQNEGMIFSFDPATNTFVKLFDFDRAWGAGPRSALMQARNGKLYGTTQFGGSNNEGVLYSFDPAANIYTKLHDFSFLLGSNPANGLIEASNGLFYGMTTRGGNGMIHNHIIGFGVIYSFDPVANTYTKLFDLGSFVGAYPVGNFVQAADGRLYGMSTSGGSGGIGEPTYGVVFAWDPAKNTYARLFEFNQFNGSYPGGSLVQAANLRLYGMTDGGGMHGMGVVFAIDPAINHFQKLLDFDGSKGSHPSANSFVLGREGRLFGMTRTGGSHNLGVLFSFDPANNAYTKLGEFDGTNGQFPLGAPVEVVNPCAAYQGAIGVPSGLSVSDITQTAATVSWNAAAGAGSYTLQYRISGAGIWNTITGPLANPYRLTDLASGRPYEFRVAGICYSKTGTFSPVATFTPAGSFCQTPTGLSVFHITGSSALFRWTPVVGVLGYTLRWKPASAPSWQTVTDIAANSYELNTLGGGTTYQVQVLAHCANGSSSFGSVLAFTTPCLPPTEIRPTFISASSTLIFWNHVPGAGSYTVQWQEAAVTGWSTFTGQKNNFYFLPGLKEGVGYNVRVATACNGANVSSFSPIVRFATLCSSLPTGLAATNLTQTAATLKWNAVSAAQSYNLQWKATSAAAWNTITGITGTVRNISGLTAGGTYQFRVQKVCREGSTPFSDPVSFTTTGILTTARLSQDGVVDAETGAALEVAPNPVRGSRAWVRYRLPSDGKVTLKVADGSGRLLQRTELGYRRAGAYTYDLRNVPGMMKGFYVLLLEQDGRVITRKQYIMAR